MSWIEETSNGLLVNAYSDMVHSSSSFLESLYYHRQESLLSCYPTQTGLRTSCCQ